MKLICFLSLFLFPLNCLGYSQQNYASCGRPSDPYPPLCGSERSWAPCTCNLDTCYNGCVLQECQPGDEAHSWYPCLCTETYSKHCFANPVYNISLGYQSSYGQGYGSNGQNYGQGYGSYGQNYGQGYGSYGQGYGSGSYGQNYQSSCNVEMCPEELPPSCHHRSRPLEDGYPCTCEPHEMPEGCTLRPCQDGDHHENWFYVCTCSSGISEYCVNTRCTDSGCID